MKLAPAKILHLLCRPGSEPIPPSDATSKQRGVAPRSQYSRTGTPANSEALASALRHPWITASGLPYLRVKKPSSRPSSSAWPPNAFSTATAS